MDANYRGNFVLTLYFSCCLGIACEVVSWVQTIDIEYINI